MWSLENRTAYAAERGWIRDADGAEVWVVAVKATYDILPDGGTRISETQAPVHSGPVPHPGAKSLRYDTDLGPAKVATDVVLCGQAHSQTGQPVPELVVGFRVGPVMRGARVMGDRHWRRGVLGLSPSKPQPFLSMPITYERAYGGDDQSAKRCSGNPVGCGASGGAAPDRIPNIEPIDARLTSPTGKVEAVAFTPIASHWPARARHAGTYDQAWFESRRPLLPTDLDPRHWQLAPPEQQVPARLHGGETVSLLNLTPAGFAPGGRISFVLPKLSLTLDTRFFDGTRATMRTVIHTLILEPDLLRFSLVHHATLPCHAKVNLLDRTIVREKARPLDRPAAPATEDLEFEA